MGVQRRRAGAVGRPSGAGRGCPGRGLGVDHAHQPPRPARAAVQSAPDGTQPAGPRRRRRRDDVARDRRSRPPRRPRGPGPRPRHAPTARRSAARLAERADHALLRLRPDRRQPARRQPDRPAGAAPLPGRRPPPDRPRRRRHRHGRRPERALRGAQPARRRDARAPTSRPSRPRSARIVDFDDGAGGTLVDNRDWTARRHACSTSSATSASTSPSTRCWPRSRCKARLAGEHGHHLHRVQLHAAAGQRLPAGCTSTRAASCRSAAPTSGATSSPASTSIRRATRRPRSTPCRWPLLTAPDGTKLGKTTGRPHLARPGPHQPVPVLPALDADRRPAGRRVPGPVHAAAASTRSTRSWPTHAAAPERRAAQRRLAGEVTALVHGDGGGRGGRGGAGRAVRRLARRRPRRGARRSWRPRCRPRRSPSTASWPRASTWWPCWSRPGWPRSKGDARRTLDQGGVYVNGERVGRRAAVGDRRPAARALRPAAQGQDGTTRCVVVGRRADRRVPTASTAASDAAGYLAGSSEVARSGISGTALRLTPRGAVRLTRRPARPISRRTGTGTRHQRSASSTCRRRRSLLENGREDEKASAGDRLGASAPSVVVCNDETHRQLSGWCSHHPMVPVPRAREIPLECEALYRRVSPLAVALEISTESLILAQDERWRRA